MEFLSQLSEEYWHLRGYSAVEYNHLLKLRPKDGVPRCYINGKERASHSGSDYYAMDIIIPDPEVNRLSIYAPASGIVRKIVDKYENATTNINESWMVNTIRIYVTPNEYYEIKHFKTGSCSLNEGQVVNADQPIAETGKSGFYLDVNSHHVHFAVHQIQTSSREVKTLPLKARFKNYNIVYGVDGSVVFKNK